MFTFGFYNSLNGDRKYNAVQISRLFEGIINDGVFASIDESLMVVEGSGMSVNVGAGRAWFNNTWNNNDAIMPLVLDPSDVVLNRIDAIVLDIQDASDARDNQIIVVKGTPGSVPVAPTMINTTGHHQYPLAHIYVGSGVTEITAANITNKVGTASCPFVTVVGLDALLPVWENEFDVWFEDLQAQMAGDVATNLQNQITANFNTEKANKPKYGTCATAAATAAKVVTQAEFSLVAGVVIAVMFTNTNTAASPTLNVNTTGVKAIYCNGVAAASNQVPKIGFFQYDGTYFQLLNPAIPIGTVPISKGGTGSTTLAAARTALGILDNFNYNYRAYTTDTVDKTFVVPAGVTKIRIWGCAAGGQSNGVGGGGMAGEYVAGTEYTVTPGSTLVITVGSGNTVVTNVTPALSLVAASISESCNWNILGVTTGVGSAGTYVNGGAPGGAYGYGGGAGTYDGSRKGSDGAGCCPFPGGVYGSGNGVLITALPIGVLSLLTLDTAGAGGGLGAVAGNSGSGRLGGTGSAGRGAGGAAGGYGAGGGSSYGSTTNGAGSPGMLIIGYIVK